jgi:hypothetical protein
LRAASWSSSRLIPSFIGLTLALLPVKGCS